MKNKEQTRLKQEAIPAFCYHKHKGKLYHYLIEREKDG
jgi:hypothetical protein